MQIMRDQLHIAAWWPTKEQPGLGIFIKEQIKSLQPFGNQHVVYLTISKNEKLSSASISLTETFEDGIHLYQVSIKTSIRKFGFHDQLVKKGYNKILKTLFKQYGFKFIHLHVRSHLTRFVFELNDFKHIPIVHTEHFSHYNRGIHLLSKREKSKEIERLKQWFSSDRLKYFLPVSKDLANTVKKDYQIDQTKVLTIPNVATAEFCSNNAIVSDVQKRITLVARWTEPKNLPLFFEALKKVPLAEKSEFVIDIIGDGDQINEVQNSKDAIKENINFHGFKSKDYIASLLSRSAFFVHPTDMENLPTVISEALCLGVPVLSMNINGIPEMIDESNGVLVQPKKPIELALAIEQMLNDYPKYDREKIANTARAKYSQESIGGKIMEIYASI